MIFMRRWRAANARLIRLKLSDSAALAALHAASFARGWSAQEFEALIASPNVDAIGAKLGSQLLGLVLARHAADEGEILSIAVAQEWQGMGLAHRLLAEALTMLARARARICYLEVDSNNRPALALYRREGFSEKGRRKGYYGSEGGGDALVLALPLTERWWMVPPPDALEQE